MNFGQYRALLTNAAVRRLVLVAMIARLPHAASGIILTLHVVNTLGLGYGAAGGVAAAVTIGLALGAPWRGRAIDRQGLRRALLPSIIAEVVVWCTAPFLPYLLLLVAAAIGGALAVPIFTVVRQALGVMVSANSRRTAYALDSIGTELTFMVGPAAGVVIATLNTTLALIVVGVASSLSGVFLYWFNPPTRSDQPGSVDFEDTTDTGHFQGLHTGPLTVVSGAGAEEATLSEVHARAEADDAGRTGRWGYVTSTFRQRMSWVTGAVLAIFAAAVGVGMSLTGTDVGIVASLRGAGHQDQIGIIFLAWCAASAIGGVVYGSLQHKVNPLWLLAAMAVLTIPMGFASDTWTLALLSIPPGLLCAPVLSSSTEWVADLVPEERRGEAMGWYGSSLTLGNAVGAPIAGAAIDQAGAWAGFTLMGGMAAILAVAGLVTQRVRRRAVSTV
ncbi:MFS transporter [Psychromicrobium xiongbiense]|uniref:MFS transporter n=1 Tax=Psychromicrobium xiongbiense TaxID=3051184 RepID=UPI0025563549|nr:MFS transporter [Psychromicrobium sp. YIM S02556]